MSGRKRKATNLPLTPEYLEDRANGMVKAGYEVPKWIVFCQVMLRDGYGVTLYEARQTVSKYVTVSKPGLGKFKVRFSNHQPIKQRELCGDCDFFVGIANLRTTTTGQAIAATREYFAKTISSGV